MSPTQQQVEQAKLQVKYDKAIKDPYEDFYEQSFPKRRRVSTKIQEIQKESMNITQNELNIFQPPVLEKGII